MTNASELPHQGLPSNIDQLSHQIDVEAVYDSNYPLIAANREAMRNAAREETADSAAMQTFLKSHSKKPKWFFVFFVLTAIVGTAQIASVGGNVRRLPSGYFEAMIAIIGFLLVLYTFMFSRSRRAIAQRTAKTVSQTISIDPRKPIVFLRSFQQDQLRVNGPFFSIRLEELLASELSDLGPVIAIGKPGEDMPLLGASRDQVPHDKWQEVVISWIKEARFVVVLLSDTPGLQWELDTIRQLGLHAKLIVLAPDTEITLTQRQSGRGDFSIEHAALQEFRAIFDDPSSPPATTQTLVTFKTRVAIGAYVDADGALILIGALASGEGIKRMLRIIMASKVQGLKSWPQQTPSIAPATLSYRSRTVLLVGLLGLVFPAAAAVLKDWWSSAPESYLAFAKAYTAAFGFAFDNVTKEVGYWFWPTIGIAYFGCLASFIGAMRDREALPSGYALPGLSKGAVSSVTSALVPSLPALTSLICMAALLTPKVHAGLDSAGRRVPLEEYAFVATSYILTTVLLQMLFERFTQRDIHWSWSSIVNRLDPYLTIMLPYLVVAPINVAVAIYGAHSSLSSADQIIDALDRSVYMSMYASLPAALFWLWIMGTKRAHWYVLHAGLQQALGFLFTIAMSLFFVTNIAALQVDVTVAGFVAGRWWCLALLVFASTVLTTLLVGVIPSVVFATVLFTRSAADIDWGLALMSTLVLTSSALAPDFWQQWLRTRGPAPPSSTELDLTEIGHFAAAVLPMIALVGLPAIYTYVPAKVLYQYREAGRQKFAVEQKKARIQSECDVMEKRLRDARLADPKKRRNPFDVDDTPELDVSAFRSQQRLKDVLKGTYDDQNAPQWVVTTTQANACNIAGDWQFKRESRSSGPAHIQIIDNKLFVLFSDSEKFEPARTWILEAVMENSSGGKVSGYWRRVGNSRDFGYYIGFVVGKDRIDGIWSEDGKRRLDFRRKIN